jgi:hypothetical protein
VRGLRAFALLALALLLIASTGCVQGVLFYHVTVPLDENFDATPAKAGRRGTSHKRLVIPYPFRMQFDWGSTAIADGMKAEGMTTAYYADVETLSFLGIWTQRWIHVYGE